MEFFHNIWTWLTDNSHKILAFLTSAQFIALVTIIINAIKQHKVIKANTLSADSLTSELKENGKNKTVLKSIDDKSNLALNKVNQVEATLDDMTNAIEVLTAKVNAILDVQSIVYTTLKDDTMRKTVNNLLLNAKYNDTEVKTKIQNELNSLKEKVTDLSAGLKDVENATVKVSNSLTDSTATIAKEDVNVMRY